MELSKRDKGTTFPFGNNVIEVAAQDVKNLDFDCISTNTRHTVNDPDMLLVHATHFNRLISRRINSSLETESI